MSAVFSYDALTGPQYVDLNGIAAGYGVLSVPVGGFLTDDVVQTVALTIVGTGLTTITAAIDMVQRSAGFYEWTSGSAIDAHFTLTGAQVALIAAAADCTYSVSIIILRNGVQQTREVQAGGIATRAALPLPPILVNSIVITGGPVSGAPGDTDQLTATTYDGFGNVITGQTVTWSSTNDNVAEVDDNGLVTLIMPGSVTIGATCQSVSATTTASCSTAPLVPSNGDALFYSTSLSAWEPLAPTAARIQPGTFSGTASSVYAFPGPVTLHGREYTWPAAEVVGGVLQSDGVGGLSWVSPVEHIGLGQLTDVTLSGVATGQFLQKSSGDWVNHTLVTADVSDLATAATGITRVGTLTTGVWNGTAITDAYLATISTAGTVANSATTATSANTASAIVARDGSGNFTAGTITATNYVMGGGGPLGYYPILGTETGVTDTAYPYDDVRRWGADPTGVTQSTDALRNAITSIGQYGQLRFTPGGTFLLDGELIPLAWQTWIQYGAMLKRCDIITDDVTTPITTSGQQSFTVSHPERWRVGMTVSWCSADGVTYSTSNHTITAIVGSTVTTNKGGSSVAFPSGCTLYTSFEFLRVSTEFDATGFKMLGGTLDGNSANNTLVQRWEIHSTVRTFSDDSLYDGVYFVNAQADGMLWAGTRAKLNDIWVYNSRGNGIHLGATYDWTASNITIVNANLGGTGVGHADGGFILSDLVHKGSCTNLYVENALSVIGSIDTDDDSEIQFTGVTGLDCARAIEMLCPNTKAGLVTIANAQFTDCGSCEFNETLNSDPAQGPYRIKLAHVELVRTKLIVVRGKHIVFDDVTVDFTGDTTNVPVSITNATNITLTSSCTVMGGLTGVYVTGICQNVVDSANHVDQYSVGASLAVSATSARCRIANASFSNTSTSDSGYIAVKLSNGTVVQNSTFDIAKGAYGIEYPVGGVNTTGGIGDGNIIRTAAGIPSAIVYFTARNNYHRNNWYTVAATIVAPVGTNQVSGNMPLDATASIDPWYAPHFIAAVVDSGGLTVTGDSAITGTLTATSFIGPVTGTATSLATGRTIAITGDLAYTSPAFDGTGNVTAAGTLATVNSNVGSFGSSTAIPVVTVNGKGLITAASTVAVVAPAGTVTGDTLAANVLTSSLTSVGVIASLTATNVAVGSLSTPATNQAFRVGGTLTASSGIATAIGAVGTLVAAANGDTMRQAFLTSAYTVGAFTGVTLVGLEIGAVTGGATNYAIRTSSGSVLLGGAVTASVGLTVTTGGFNVGAGGVTLTGSNASAQALLLTGALSGTTSASGVLAQQTIGSGVTSSALMFTSTPTTATAAYTLAALYHFRANDVTIGAGSAVTTQYAFHVPNTFAGAGTNYAFYNASAATSYLGGALTVVSGAANTVNTTHTGGGVTGSGANVTLDVSETWNTSGNPTAIRLSVTNTANGGSARMLDLRAGAAGATSVFAVGVSGSITTTGSAYFGGGAVTTANVNGFVIENRGSLAGGASTGILTLLNAAGTGFTRLNIGGTTTSFASITASGTALATARGDGSAGGSFQVTGTFGCNNATPQASYASGGALAAYSTGAFGFDSEPHAAALYAMVVSLRAALVANGIMS